MAAKTGIQSKRFRGFAIEHIYVIIFTFTHEVIMKFGFTPEAEILNARLAMLGFVIAVGTYLTTGQIIPGVL
ncbi:high light inducible protein [Synechococcus phage ACG-2014f]|uniref:High light inducible protein n=6 Tax=Kyanoviridae TaxID=2946160 RepID=A0A0E3G1X9_9CAUD|nr:high light inducible protein [Synechococcus phage ACG-2014f]YP_009778386.1 high light inducible protein [Synechococcus phage ACG-2014f_Syn7803C7]YP_009778673.1 high light inducible protein [Synechococcus phage ACG-2014f_Syn7803C8]YP_009778949.1 high light inducible protein [Synechococcus phage ACG-2014f_Syn7803US26]AIX16753.1 high light inducible protein [Synechococcus phage ACG-2014f]AIX18531.1 high light inducible protein [Synechococcus phage ACG-2014f]AIX20123.1 high light inducible pro